MPDPEVDAIHAIFYAIFDDIPLEKGSQTTTGVMMVDAASCDASKGRCGPGSQTFLSKCGLMDDLDITYVATETDLLMEVIKMVDRWVTSYFPRLFPHPLYSTFILIA